MMTSRISLLAMAGLLACGGGKVGSAPPPPVNPGGDDAGGLPSAAVGDPAPGGGGRNFYVGVLGACPPAGYPALAGGACLASLDDVHAEP